MIQNIPEDFTWALVLFDTLPVILFIISSVIISIRFKNPIFSSGAALCALAGLGKVFWKIILVATGTNVPFLFFEFRVTMPLGFILILFSFLIVKRTINWKDVKRRLTDFPAIIFFSLTIIGLIGMIVIKNTMDMTSLKANWIAEITNSVAQGNLLLGLLTMEKHSRERAPEEDLF